MTRHPALLLPVLMGIASATASAIELSSEATAAWNQYVANAAAHLHESGNTSCATTPSGHVVDIEGGTIHHWRGATVVHGMTVDSVVNTLIRRGVPPPQDDVLESRVLRRHGNSLRVYLKLARSAIVTVVYDTEHEVTFTRHSSVLATSRSVSTKIAETDGSDRGFLWRLNSYWRYTQVGHDVRIDLESLSLSRDIPFVVRPMAVSIINRIARESVTRTLSSLQRFLEHRGSDHVDVAMRCADS
jgi:hypothetical protein